MVERLGHTPQSLYLADETAWLELTAQQVADGRWNEIDRDNLSEYLTDMAARDRREVMSRLVVLLTHLLKWVHQANKQTGSWKATIAFQKFELQQLLESGTLCNHAGAILEKAYARAVDQATTGTGLPATTFPQACPYSLDDLLAEV
jgi:hypothetical protein